MGSKNKKNNKEKKKKAKQDINLYVPFKSSPCKHCPALHGGICKCAKKRLKK